jgi:hypothetical protein
MDQAAGFLGGRVAIELNRRSLNGGQPEAMFRGRHDFPRPDPQIPL